MCGIIGYISSEPNDSLTNKLRFARDLMSHRGPDGSGIWFSVNKKIGLAHRRLSIIDLSEKANQPLFTSDGTVGIVFNGEIYNHREIRAELEQKKIYEWQTDHSDTEVILNSYLEWGIECIHKFRGMFAFSLFDTVNSCMFVVRDRMGIKPLYYFASEKDFVFASEIKPIMSMVRECLLNYDAVVGYLMQRSSISPHTLVQNVLRLDAGSYLKITSDAGKIRVTETKYYDVWGFQNLHYDNHENEKVIETSVHEMLVDSIKYRYESDVPVCLFLSGGIDSSLIAAISARDLNMRPATFTVGLKNDIRDEFPFADKVNKQYGFESTVVYLNMEKIDMLDEWLEYNDDLTSDPSAFAMFLLSKEMNKQGFKVALSGEGSDEVFGGYDRYLAYLGETFQYDKGSRFNGLSIILKGLHSLIPSSKLEKTITKLFGNHFYFGQANINNLLSLSALVNDTKYINKFIADQTSHFDIINPEDKLRYALLYDMAYRLPNDLLIRTDRASMSSHIEARVPFLDHELINKAVKLPNKSLFGRDYRGQKEIIKKIALEYFDHDFVFRKKTGFPMPVDNWLLKPKISSEFLKYIEDGAIALLNYEYVKKTYVNHLNGQRTNTARLFNLYMLEKHIRILGLI